jgi:triacylglycerol lipase|tara:strand:- start:23434 stop:24102 length:669 start_codon:yes stop_codon:yes gene_type:complete
MPWHKPRVREARVNPGDAVILLHGLWRSLWAMEPMAQFLNEQGYHTINVPYPSFRKPMEELTEIIHDALKLHGGDRKVHFVTHSLGGVLARQLLHQLPPDLAGRVVMLAPPHQGSEIVDYLSRYGPMRLSLGPAGMQLGSGKIDAPTLPEEIDSAIIMGKQSFFPLFRRLLDDDNDGFVSVERGKIDGMNEFHVVDADHTFIASEPRVMEMTHKFLRDGPSN